MAKLIVEVLDACDLMPKDGQGSANPFVEVEFEDQRHRTQTKKKDLNPVWNEKLVFNVSNPKDLHNATMDVLVYNDQQSDHHKNFLGRVRIYGTSIPFSESEAMVQRYPLEKRGMFSRIRGDIALKIYAVLGNSHSVPPQVNSRDTSETPFQAPNITSEVRQDMGSNSIPKKEKKEKETRSFYSVGTSASTPAPQAGKVETRSDSAKAGPPSVLPMQVFPTNPEFELVETRPQIAAHLRYQTGDKTLSTYDLVEQMQFLYVNVVKARDLPTMDVSGSLDPYVEVKLGNYKGITKHFEKNQNPVWHEVFAFSKDRIQSNVLEVTVKDKDVGKDDFVGKVVFDVSEVLLRFPPDSPLAPQWYKLEDKKNIRVRGELMLAVWMGTQADECFPVAWINDAHDLNQDNLTSTRSKVYFTPRLYYLRIHVIEAQDLVPWEKGRVPDAYMKIQLGNQVRGTRISHSIDPKWNEEHIFVVCEPKHETIVITVEDRIASNKEETLGRVMIPVTAAITRTETVKPVSPRWFNLEKPSSLLEEKDKKKEVKFASKIHLRLCLDIGYHVLDESTLYSSDLRPTAKYLSRPLIGILEIGILDARNLHPMKGNRTDAYCVAKYGNKWVRTRTILDTNMPRWNEQYTWQVFDPCTVITIGVFDNSHVSGSKEDAKDQKIGKVRIRLSTLEIDRVYTHYYPLLLLQPSGLKKTGELHLALRFTCTAWMNMLILYGKPLLPKMHYYQSIPIQQLDLLRYQAVRIVHSRLERCEPPLRKETVDYMLDVDFHMWSLRRSKANFNRIRKVTSGLLAVLTWFDDICNWKNPVTTILVCVLFLILVWNPELILPTVFLYLFVIGIWNYRFRPRKPPHMDPRLSEAEFAISDELDEEFDSFPTSKPTDIVRKRYDRLRTIGAKVQKVAGDLATQGERAHALLNWRDPRATTLFIIFSLICAAFLYITPFPIVATLIGLYLLRHPKLRSKLPSAPFNFYRRLPAKSDMIF